MMEPATSCHAFAVASPSDEAKLFVGGLSWKTTEDSLKEYFAKYGEVASANVVRNKDTSASRGFAFVLFADSAAAERALADTNDHVISGRRVDVKKARTRCSGHQNHQHAHSLNGIPVNPRKIFVGGLSPGLTKVEFSNYFEQFGAIKDVVMFYDNSGRSRRFGFVQFHSVDAVEKVVQNRFHKLKDKMVEVKIAVPQNTSNNNKEINHHSLDSGNSNKDINHHSSGDSSNNNKKINHNSDNENTMIDGRGGYASDDYQPSLYHPMYDLSNIGLHGYMPPVVSGYTYGSNSFIGGYTYNSVGYNFLPSPPAWQSLIPYSSTSLHPGYLHVGFNGCMNLPYISYNASMGYGYSRYENWNQNSYDMQSWNVDNTAAPQAAHVGGRIE